MRHVAGFILAIAMAAAVFFGGGWGYDRLLRLPVPGGSTSTLPAGGGSLLGHSSVLYAFAALAGIALLAGVLIAMRQISPLASGLPGVLLIAWTVLYLVRADRAVQYIPLKSDAFGTGFEAMLINGVLALAGVAMIIPMFIPSRWREEGEYGPANVLPGSNVGLLSDWSESTIQQPPVQ